MKVESLPVYEVAEAKVVDFYAAAYAAYQVRQRKRAANRERVYVLGFEDWFANVFCREKVAA